MASKPSRPPGQGERRTVRWAGGELEYLLTRKAVKNLNLRIGRDGLVRVSAPRRVPAGTVDEFVRSKAAFVRRHLDEMAAQLPAPHPKDRETVPYLGRRLRLESGPGPEEVRLEGDRLLLTLPRPEDVQARDCLLQGWLERESRTLLAGMAEQVGRRFAPLGVAPTRIRVREMVSRWGSCSPRTGAITLNARLVGAPPACTEYVVVHEFAHLVHPNHSPAFWALVERFLPDWRARRDALNRRQRELGL